MKIRRIGAMVAASMLVVLIAGVLLYSCSSGVGGGGTTSSGTVAMYVSGGGGTTSSGKVAMYVADDISLYKQVIATINKIDILHAGSGASCSVFTGPLTLDIANLAGVMQLINVASCPAVPYNRIHIEFAKSVALMDSFSNTSTCMFTSYSYNDDHNNPNRIVCGTDTCTLDINGAVNVLVNQQNKLALDFDLKEFIISYVGDPPICSVTMKVSPLHAGEMEARGHPEAFTGLVSGLSTTDKTFTLTRGNTAFSVFYSGITTSQQPGIYTLLQQAQTDQLRVKVMASQIDLTKHTIEASAIYVKVEGTIAADSLNATTFTLNYRSGKSIVVDYSSAIVEGDLPQSSWVEVKLYGFNETNFLASRVEVEAEETSTED